MYRSFVIKVEKAASLAPARALKTARGAESGFIKSLSAITAPNDPLLDLLAVKARAAVILITALMAV